ncbi:MAG: hypothetical protein JJE39_07090 [Vicinamibacteria bacterium]|nr:hypothetical protein [Vicinamibacteria bacterium]
MKTKKTTAKGLRKGTSPGKGQTTAPDHPVRPSMGDPEREQMLPADGDLPDLGNETVHKTERPEGAILEDDDLDDELAEEHAEDRREDVTESNPLHVGHFVGR